MNVCRRAEFRRGKGVVVVEPEGGGRVVIRAGIRSFVNGVGQSPEYHN
jgi:hypothetical protein